MLSDLLHKLKLMTAIIYTILKITGEVRAFEWSLFPGRQKFRSENFGKSLISPKLFHICYLLAKWSWGKNYERNLFLDENWIWGSKGELLLRCSKWRTSSFLRCLTGIRDSYAKYENCSRSNTDAKAKYCGLIPKLVYPQNCVQNCRV